MGWRDLTWAGQGPIRESDEEWDPLSIHTTPTEARISRPDPEAAPDPPTWGNSVTSAISDERTVRHDFGGTLVWLGLVSHAKTDRNVCRPYKPCPAIMNIRPH